MSLGTILLVLLILMLIGAIPTWPHSKSWGYGPSGGLGLVVIIGMVTWYDAQLWFHPFGPLTKNVSILIGTLVILRHCRAWSSTPTRN